MWVCACVCACFMKMVFNISVRHSDVKMLLSGTVQYYNHYIWTQNVTLASGPHFLGTNLQRTGLHFSVTLQPFPCLFWSILLSLMYLLHMVHLLGMTEQK